MSALPQLFRLRQQFDDLRVDDIEATVRSQLAGLRLERKIRAGQSVAVTAGSRGIANIRQILKATVQHLQSLGAVPFLVPAMGSHGGATAEGQRRVIEGYGITEAYCGCEIRSSMETVVVCQTREGFPVHFDRHAHQADHVLVCGRVKPHTDFAGDIESGLMKMMLIGLGKHAGAAIYHRAVLDYNFGQIVRSVAAEVLHKCRIVAGLGIVENGYEQTARIEAVAPEHFEEREKQLLVLAKKLLPHLPFERIDLLLIDEIGKNISGTGMDTNIVGRKFNDHEAVEGEFPKVRRIAVRGLSDGTHGNAIGIGLAEFCTTGLVRQIDLPTTRVNTLTSGHVSAGMLPLDFETDRQMVDAALATAGLVEPPNAKVVWIHNTLELAEIECSAALLAAAQGRDRLEVCSPLRDWPFDVSGSLPAAGMRAMAGANGAGQRITKRTLMRERTRIQRPEQSAASNFKKMSRSLNKRQRERDASFWRVTSWAGSGRHGSACSAPRWLLMAPPHLGQRRLRTA